MNSPTDYAASLLAKARDDGYVIGCISTDADELARLTPFGVALRHDNSADDDEPTLQRQWAADVVGRVLGWASSFSS